MQCIDGRSVQCLACARVRDMKSTRIKQASGDSDRERGERNEMCRERETKKEYSDRCFMVGSFVVGYKVSYLRCAGFLSPTTIT